VLCAADGDIEELRSVVVWSLGVEPPTRSRLSEAVRDVDRVRCERDAMAPNGPIRSPSLEHVLFIPPSDFSEFYRATTS
jgi:hypothetical protein